MFGWLRSGFIRKTLWDIRANLYNTLRDKWKDRLAPGVDLDLSDDSLPAMLLQVIAIEASILWQATESVFYSRFVGTARGKSLDYLGQRLMLPRRKEKKATGTFKATGSPGTVIAAGEIATAFDGTEFEVTTDRTIPDSGVIDIRLQARKAGAGGNRAGGTWLLRTGNAQIEGGYDEQTFSTFGESLISGYKEITPEDRLDTYQKIKTVDLAYPLTLDALKCKVRNPTNETQVYFLYLVVSDAATGQIIGETQIHKFSLDANAETTVEFSGQGFDVSNYDEIMVSFSLGNGSTSNLEIAYNNTAPYNGLAAWEGAPLPDSDFYLALTTTVTGVTTGGASAENDVAYSARQMRAMARAAAGIPAAIESNLWAVEGVRSVRVDWNAGLDVDANGVPPKSVRATVAGGNVREIARTLLEKGVGAGIATAGSDTIAIQTSFGGQAVPVSFERPQEIPIYIRVRLITEPGRILPDSFITQIKDSIVAYIGGAASDGTYYAGLMPGENVSRAQIDAAVCRFAGVASAVVRLSRKGIPASDSAGTGNDIEISTGNPVEIAVTKPAYIEVV